MDHQSYSGKNINSVTIASVKAILTKEQQFELYQALQQIFSNKDNSSNGKKDDIRDRLRELEKKYFDLVWITRNISETPDIRKIFNETSAKYPGELEKLQNVKTGNWQHGFNSGMLACVRLLFAYTSTHNRQAEIEQAEEDFPMLDT
jgi:hypothetical protein